ncbi:DUF4149 domain-containing protein [Verminephrobacter aporrectodeae]|uniref:DUF4149 domain-containing protein n=1 Tax=Verminephrobacter aporrectodeae subsp. tuberculatae TaxID=1110392 RepID=A0ABT3KQX6_9BURK|nr:DUF4149 domain-containing protein [Verminephrobacter aporrectodeae]MCW5255705.1 DUF4149 domain-containing protein [Verminephrobacter aporrectodeae subsp. tuberculatae]MCW5320724.1 DUF4149 domain-containing protein [Verminephrobacter aporrectodeae subsp. tuberculatae]MCW8177022.1 DUF4149 domain-containing protein [Verminephrobacter aporrectodeae subsp. tuberculatae]MCW8204466.1 DUF4149 domain-containing protein [Verminephrobacter aporrectodeae subsp. tuberculatae]
MRRAPGLRRRLPALAAALWWGSLSTLGLLVAPLLFAKLPTPALAGGMAAELFAAQTWVTLACGLVLLFACRPKHAAPYPWARDAMVCILGGMLLALLSQFGVAPRIVARQDLRWWHGVGTVMYAVQWCCALAVLWRILGQAPAPDGLEQRGDAAGGT